MSRQARYIWVLLDSRMIGGIETHVLELTHFLQKEGYSVTLCFLSNYSPHPLEPFLEQHQITYRYFDGSLFGLYKHLKKEAPAILHTHGYKAGLLGRITSLFTPTACISTFHAGEPGKGKLALYTKLDQKTAKLANEVIAVSDSIAKSLPQKTHIIGNFITPPLYSKKHPLQQNTAIRVAFVGRMSEEKGPDLFLACAAALNAPASSNKKTFEFHLFGDGPLLEKLLEQYPPSQYPHITFHGNQIMGEQWPTIDILMITSRHEALPLVTLEAMAHGIPVIASPVGALPNLVTDNKTGWLCAPTDTKKLVQHLHHWQQLSLSDKKHICETCHLFIKNEYSANAIAPKITALYQKYL